MYSLLRKLALASLVLGIATALPVSVVHAQGMGAQAQGMGMGMGTDSPRFAVAPQVGDQMPDLQIFDDMGQPVSIGELTNNGENYSVLTLGCLT